MGANLFVGPGFARWACWPPCGKAAIGRPPPCCCSHTALPQSGPCCHRFGSNPFSAPLVVVCVQTPHFILHTCCSWAIHRHSTILPPHVVQDRSVTERSWWASFPRALCDRALCGERCSTSLFFDFSFSLHLIQSTEQQELMYQGASLERILPRARCVCASQVHPILEQRGPERRRGGWHVLRPTA